MVDNRQSTLLTPTVPLYNGSPFKPKKKGGSGGGPQSTLSTPTQAAKTQAQAQAEAAMVERMRQEGLKRLAAEKAAAEKIKNELSRRERLSLIAREQLRRAAIARNRGFTRLEAQRFLKARGGSITSLRSAKRKGFILQQENYIPKEVSQTTTRKAFVSEPISSRSTKEISKSKKGVPFSKLIGIDFKKIKTGADIISGGYFTEKNLDKKENTINKDIETFNKKYGGKELSEEEYKKASSLAKSIEDKQGDLIKQRDNLADSLRSKVGNFLYRNIGDGRITSTQLKETIQKNQPKIKQTQQDIKKLDEQISKEVKKDGLISKINLKRLKALKSAKLEQVELLKTGTPYKIMAGEFPIIPAVSIPSGVTTIKFIGAQKKAKGGKIITDIAFRTSTGKIGVAKGVSVAKGKNGASIFLGRSGKRVFKFPSGKSKIINLETFIGREKTLTRPGTIKLAKNIDILNRAKKTGTAVRVTKNLKVLKQAGIGQVGTVRGKKLLKAGKAVKGITVDNFASMSAILTKKDLSLIVGKSITEIGAKSKFIGLIKGTSKASEKTFTLSQKQQYQKALKKVVSTMASSLAKAEKTGNLPKTTSLALAAKLAIAEAKPTKPGKLVSITKAKPKITIKPQSPGTTIQIRKIKTAQATRSITRNSSSQKRKQETAQNTAQKAKQETRQIVRQISKQKVRQKARQRVRPRSLQKQRQLLRPVKRPGIKIVPRGPRVPIIPRLPKGIKKRKRRLVKKVTKAYNVYARPLKKTKKGKIPKLIKVNKAPLSKSQAQDLRNYITDTSLSRTAQLKPTKGKPQKSELKIPKGYAKKTAKKFRTYRIVKGKRVSLPRNKIIEKRKNILDTRQEKRKITLRKRIKQITRRTPKRSPSRRPAQRRTVVRRSTARRPRRKR